MFFPFIGLVFGVMIGIFSPYVFSAVLMPYVGIGILACTDSVLGGVRSYYEEKFDLAIFISGFFGNAVIAIFLVWLGGILNLQLSIAAIVVYGSRLFQNFASIRRYIFK